MNPDPKDELSWRARRDRFLQYCIGDPNAVAWVLDLSDSAEMFDDLIDKDHPVDDAQVVRVLRETLLEMPANPFFVEHRQTLLPVLRLAALAWQIANSIEKRFPTLIGENAMHVSFVLRNICTLIVPFVVEILRGNETAVEIAPSVIDFVVENDKSFQEYLDEHRKAPQDLKGV